MPRERPLPPNPPNEAERLEAVHEIVPELGLGDGAPEDPMLQMLCKTICKLFKVPIAGVSIVNKDTYSMRACQGLPPQFKIPRHDAFCAWTLLPKVPETLVIEDMKEDQRFKDHPNVHPDAGGLRFYAGSPLITSTNFLLGSVCILDVGPRKMKAEDFNILANFSEMAVRRLEEKHFPKVKNNVRLLRAPEDTIQPVVLCDLSNYRWWSVLYANESFGEVAGVGHTALSDSTFWKLFRPAGTQAKHKILEDLESAIENGEDFSVSVRRRESVLDGNSASKDSMYEISFRPATTQNLGVHAGKISVPNIIAAVELGASNSSYFFAMVTKSSKTGESDEVPIKAEHKSTSIGKRRQQTFYSKKHQAQNPIGSKQPADVGINDVQMGVLFCQTDTGLGYRGRWNKKPVSVKVVEADKKECIRAPAFGVAYVPKEAALCIGVDHSSILATNKIVVENIENDRVKAWIVRDWCSGGTLDDAITRGWFLNEADEPNWSLILNTALQVAKGVAHMHEEGIVFGFLNAYGIQLEKREEKWNNLTIKLQEFGHAVKTEDTASAGKINVPSHAAPEVFAKNQISKPADVYAFGMLWWEIVESKLLWPSLSAEQVQKKAASKQMPTFPQEYDSGIKALLESCIALKPAQRPSFAQIVARLNAMAAEYKENKPMTGQTDNAAPAPAVRRLFNTKTPPISESNKSMDTEEKKVAEKPTMLEKASEETADTQKKSMFKRFAAKFKT